MTDNTSSNENSVTQSNDNEAFNVDYESRFHGYHDLMRSKIREILLVSSLYDAFTLEEDGGLSEQIFGEYRDLELTSPPRITRVSSANDAFKELSARQYDLIITMTHIIDLDPIEFGKKVKELQPETPVVLLITDIVDLQRYHVQEKHEGIDKVFIWTGDSSLFLAIIKYFEDLINVEQDTKKGIIQVILVIENSSRYYSIFLPLIYKEVMQQTRDLIAQGLNEHEKLLRRRARPKILLAETFEEAIELYEKYSDHIFGIFTDVTFSKDGKSDQNAGFKFVELIDKEIPVIMQSSHSEHRKKAETLNIPFLDKNSKKLLYDLRKFMKKDLGFGKFVFRMPDGREFGRAADMTEFIQLINTVPDDSLRYHAENNHFSRWLIARGEFELALKLKIKRIADFKGFKEVRVFLIDMFRETSRKKQVGVITDFQQQKFEFEDTITRFGNGSLGGKGRGIAFLNVLLQKSHIARHFPEYKIRIPETLIIGTRAFEKFIIDNALDEVIDTNIPDNEIALLFMESKLSDELIEALKKYLAHVKMPIAVRSSSLLEDSHNQPFAGIYDTYLLPNNHKSAKTRLKQLTEAVKLVYASAFFQSAKAYIQATLHKAEEEKMGVVIQKLVGNQFGNRFYPIFAGVAQSRNFYPLPPIKRGEPISSVALGLGKIVVDGEQVLTFSPLHPNAIPGFATSGDILEKSQRKFYALDLSKQNFDLSKGEDATLISLDISKAEKDNTLDDLASVYDPVDDRFRDGSDFEGNKVITFGPILKYETYPLAKIIKELLEISERGMGCAVEMEFAASVGKDKKFDFYLLQIRPLISIREHKHIDINKNLNKKKILAFSSKALGNGIVENIKDVVFVTKNTFDRLHTVDIANEIGEINAKLNNEPYILIGPGRWGSNDRWLGIPVTWDQISGARTIVETPIEDIRVDPSHGSHFFHNVTSLGIPYLTLTYGSETDFIDWSWLEKLPVSVEKRFVRHLHFKSPLIIKVDGRCGFGLIQKA